MFLHHASGHSPTFLFLRNGDNLYCIETAIDFGANIFPDFANLNLSEPMLIESFGGSFKKLIPQRLVEDEAERHRLHKIAADAWTARYGEIRPSNPNYGAFDMPRYPGPRQWGGKLTQFSSDSVFFDDAQAHLKNVQDDYNRIAIVIQGLYDRSDILAPHGPVKLWDHESAAANIEFVFEERALYAGEKPDFHTFRDRLNADATRESVFVGQEEFWLEAEAERENNRQKKDWRIRTPSNYKRFKPEWISLVGHF